MRLGEDHIQLQEGSLEAARSLLPSREALQEVVHSLVRLCLFSCSDRQVRKMLGRSLGVVISTHGWGILITGYGQDR